MKILLIERYFNLACVCFIFLLLEKSKPERLGIILCIAMVNQNDVMR